METTRKSYYVAGDVAGVEEASSAMIEGLIAGVAAASSLGYSDRAERLIENYKEELGCLRVGPVGTKIREGLEQVIL